MSSLRGFLEKRVAVITANGQYYVGVLEGYDNNTNLVLSNTIERIIKPDEDGITEKLGAFVIRGDNVVCVGLVDEKIDNEIDWNKVHGQPFEKGITI